MSANVAHELKTKVGDMTGATAIITIGTNFPDAIGVSPLACAKLWPVILTDKHHGGALHASALAALTDLGITKALKVGTYATLRAVSQVWPTSPEPTATSPTPMWPTGPRPTPVLASCTSASRPETSSPMRWPLDRISAKTGHPAAQPAAGPAAHAHRYRDHHQRGAVQQVTFIAMIEPVVSQVKALLP